MTNPDLRAAAQAIADAFNARHGIELLCLAPPPADLVTPRELLELAEREPGDYTAGNAYQAIKGRRPTRGEAVRLGHLLGFLAVVRQEVGPTTLWRLDNAFAQRAH